MYRVERHQSPFSIRTQVRGAFSDLFEAVAEARAKLVLSYSPPGGGTAARPETRTIKFTDLVDLSQAFFTDIEVAPLVNSKHSRFNTFDRHGQVPTSAESLIIARP